MRGREIDDGTIQSRSHVYHLPLRGLSTVMKVVSSTSFRISLPTERETERENAIIDLNPPLGNGVFVVLSDDLS